MDNMALFDKKYASRGTEKKQFIGAQLPQQSLDYLILYAIINNSTKTRVLKLAIDQLGDKKGGINNLIDEFVHKAHNEYELKKDEQSPTDFVQSIKRNLIKSKMSTQTMNQIISKLSKEIC
jgi:signal recognition particle GTPase